MEYNTTFKGKAAKKIDCNVDAGKKVQAGVEGPEYEFGKIPNSEYMTCIHGDNLYIVLQTDKTVQCTCDYFQRNFGMVCEHILALRDFPAGDFEAAPADIVTLLEETEGWTTSAEGILAPPSKRVAPEVVATLPPEDADTEEQPTEKPEPAPMPKQPLCVATCQFCNMDIKAGTQRNADLRCAKHEKLCKERPTGEPDVSKTEPTTPPVETKKKKTVKAKTPVPPDVPEKVPAVKETPVPTVQPEKKAHPTPTAVSNDVRKMPSEAEFQQAKVGRILANQGSIYKVGGKETPDSAAVSNYAIANGASTETTVLEQTKEYARATVRAYKGGRYAEGSVLIRKDAIFEKVVIDLAERNPEWIIGWSEGLPEFDLNQLVHIGEKRKILGLHIAGVVADKWMFASRDCETKAGRRAMIKILGADWREADEIESEVDEMKTVAKR